MQLTNNFNILIHVWILVVTTTKNIFPDLLQLGSWSGKPAASLLLQLLHHQLSQAKSITKGRTAPSTPHIYLANMSLKNRRNNLWLLCQIFLLKNNLQGCLVDFFGQFSHFRLCRLCGFRDSWHACPQQRGGCGGGDHCRGRSHFPGTSEFQDPPNLHPTMWAGESMCSGESMYSGVPWGDHPDASCAALQLSLLFHALPSCHVLHSWQVLLMPCWPYCIINLILYFAGKLLLTYNGERYVGADCGRSAWWPSSLEKPSYNRLCCQVCRPPTLVELFKEDE